MQNAVDEVRLVINHSSVVIPNVLFTHYCRLSGLRLPKLTLIGQGMVKVVAIDTVYCFEGLSLGRQCHIFCCTFPRSWSSNHCWLILSLSTSLFAVAPERCVCHSGWLLNMFLEGMFLSLFPLGTAKLVLCCLPWVLDDLLQYSVCFSFICSNEGSGGVF